jgi:serine/threonine-protein kinase
MNVCLTCGRLYGDDVARCAIDGEELLPHEPSYAAGVTVAGCTIVGALGLGGCGELFEAKVTASGDRVVLRLVSEELTNDKRHWDGVRRHLLKAKDFRHPSVAPVRNVALYRERNVIVRDWVDGERLQDVLAGGKALPFKQALAIAVKVGSVLVDAHKAGLLHLQLRPSNVLLLAGTEDDVRVIDFGLGPFRRVGNRPVFGTLRTLSPEQIEGKLPSFKSDIYGLGLLLYRMVVGSSAFSGTDEELARRVLEDPIPEMISPTGETLPSGLETLVRQMTDKKPAARPTSTLQVVERLRRVQDIGAMTAAPPRDGQVAATAPTAPSCLERATIVLQARPPAATYEDLQPGAPRMPTNLPPRGDAADEEARSETTSEIEPEILGDAQAPPRPGALKAPAPPPRSGAKDAPPKPPPPPARLEREPKHEVPTPPARPEPEPKHEVPPALPTGGFGPTLDVTETPEEFRADGAVQTVMGWLSTPRNRLIAGGGLLLLLIVVVLLAVRSCSCGSKPASDAATPGDAGPALDAGPAAVMEPDAALPAPDVVPEHAPEAAAPPDVPDVAEEEAVEPQATDADEAFDGADEVEDAPDVERAEEGDGEGAASDAVEEVTGDAGAGEASAVDLALAGNRALSARQFQRARRLYDQALELDPENRMANIGLGRTAFQEGKFAEAVRYLAPIYRGRGNIELGVAYVRVNRLQDAKQQFERILARNPNDADARRALDALNR